MVIEQVRGINAGIADRIEAEGFNSVKQDLFAVIESVTDSTVPFPDGYLEIYNLIKDEEDKPKTIEVNADYLKGILAELNRVTGGE